MASDVSEVLELQKGSTVPFDVFVFNQEDQAEDLTIYNAATLSIREEETGADLVLLRTADANLAIDTANKKLTGSMSQAQADALKVGRLILDVALRETSTSRWRHLERLYTRVVNTFSPHTA